MSQEPYHTEAQPTTELTPNQRRTLAARKALAAKFATSEEKSEHYRELAHRSHESRLTLSGGEAGLILDDLRHAMAVQDWRRVADVVRHLEIRMDKVPS